MSSMMKKSQANCLSTLDDKRSHESHRHGQVKSVKINPFRNSERII